jgi:hypothetical protein
MNPEQDRDAFATTEIIAEHLVYAWNYCATLRGFHRHARECPDVLDTNGHLISTITFALWDALFMKLAHCSDRRKEATGFPKLFKQLRAYLPENHHLHSRVAEKERQLASLHAQKKVENWRKQVVAHHTIISNFSQFYKENVCSLDEIESLVRALNDILHSFSLEIWNQGFCVEDLGHHAHQGVDSLVEAMKKGKPNQALNRTSESRREWRLSESGSGHLLSLSKNSKPEVSGFARS